MKRQEEIKEEPKIETIKFNHPEVKEEMTRENIEDIIQAQENAIEDDKKSIKRREDCIKHYKQYL